MIRIKSIEVHRTTDAGDQIIIYAERDNQEYSVTSGACRSCGEEFFLNNIKTAMNKLLRQMG